MLISHSKKFIFLANPKTGSQSIQKILDPHSEVRPLPRKKSTPDQRRASGFHNHITARDLKETFEKEGWDWSNYYSFTMIRNPWDRVVSMYEFGLQTPGSSQGQKAVEAGDFANFVRNARIRPIDKHAFDEKGNQLVTKIIRLEDIETEIPPLLERLGIQVEEIPHINKSKRKPYQEYYNEETSAVVRERFAKDIEVGNYQFEK